MEFVIAIFAAVCAALGGAAPLFMRWYIARSKRRIEADQAKTVDERIVP